MKSDSQIIDELHALEAEQAALKADTDVYMAICQKLNSGAERHVNAVNQLNAIVFGESQTDLRDGVKAVRFTHRDQGLLMLEASRQLSKMAAKCLSTSEKMAAIISAEGEGGV